jgi:hypothetical protein
MGKGSRRRTRVSDFCAGQIGRKTWISIGALVVLSACANLPARDLAKCKSYGFKPETVAMAQCLQNEEKMRRDWVTGLSS